MRLKMNNSNLPTLANVRSMVRWNPISSKRDKILNAYLLDEKDESGQMVIAAIIEPRKRIQSVTFSSNYHAKFTSEDQKPSFDGRRIDIQFFYLNEELPSHAVPLC